MAEWTTETTRAAVVRSTVMTNLSGESFDAWLAAHDAQVKAEALRDYAQHRFLAYLDHPETPWLLQPEGMARRYAKTAADLMAEADRLAGGEQP